MLKELTRKTPSLQENTSLHPPLYTLVWTSWMDEPGQPDRLSGLGTALLRRRQGKAPNGRKKRRSWPRRHANVARRHHGANARGQLVGGGRSVPRH